MESDFNPYLPIVIPDDRNDEVAMIDTTHALLNVSGMINLNAINNHGSESSSNALNNSKISNSVTVKKECEEKELSKNVKFTTKEDDHLISAIKKHWRKSWSGILKDKNFEFHASRTRDSLRVRAEAAQFKRRLKTLENLNSSKS